MMKQTLFTIILLLLTIVIVKSQRVVLVPELAQRYIEIINIEIIDLPYKYNEYEKDNNASYDWWDDRQKFHFY